MATRDEIVSFHARGHDAVRHDPPGGSAAKGNEHRIAPTGVRHARIIPEIICSRRCDAPGMIPSRDHLR